MGMADDIRVALKSAPGALTAAEIGETLGESGGDVSKALYPMVKTGEVDKQEVDGGRATYVRNPAFTGKRATNAAARASGDKVPRKSGTRRAKAAPIDRKRKAKPAKGRVSKQSDAVVATAVDRTVAHQAEPASSYHTNPISLSRKTVRTLLAFIMQSTRPLDCLTREAVTDAIKEAA